MTRIVLSAIASSLLLGACCLTPSALNMAEPGSGPGPGEAIIFGKIVISPPLDDHEQRLDTVQTGGGGCLINPTAGKYRNTVILLTDRTPRKISDPGISDYKNRIEAPIGKTFYVKAPATEPLYVVRSEIQMSLHGGGLEKAVLPSGYKIDVQRGDGAVYIGTIKYYRDEFFTTKRIEIIDDFEQESAAFRKKFGGRIAVRKALVKK